MKFLLVFAVVWIAFWIWRQGRRAELRERKPPAASSVNKIGQPQEMIACARCGLHLPATDAVQGHQGSYCSAAHLHLAED
jgi:uncharacterized protein